MKLFVNSRVCQNDGTYKVHRLRPNAIRLSVPNYCENKKSHVDFIFTGFDVLNKNVQFNKNLLLECSTFEQTDENVFHFHTSKYCTKNDTLYALVKGASVPQNDILIPINMKSKLEIIRTIRYKEYKEKFGEFFSNVYLIKVKLDINESLPLYYIDGNIISEHDVIYGRDWAGGTTLYRVASELKTFILFQDEEKYISLSKIK